MAFAPDQHLRNLKGQQYLDVKWRLVWLREEHPEAQIKTEMAHLDSEEKLAVFRAEVTIPGKGSATGYGSETERDFPSGFIEKAECVPLRSQILTRSGFRHFDEVVVGEDVLAYDPETDTTRWTPLLAVNVFPQGDLVRLSNSQGFSVDCTFDHSWPVLNPTLRSGQPVARRLLRKTHSLRASDRLILAAQAEGGDSALTPEEAAIIGWLFTDGTVKRKGRYVRGSIMQSKPEQARELRALVGTVATEYIGKPTTRTFPGGHTYDCKPDHTFILPAPLTRRLFEKAGIKTAADLPGLATRLSVPARQAMLHAMMRAEGTQRRVFAQTKPHVLEAFHVLAMLEGSALGSPRVREVGCIEQKLKTRRHLCASQLRCQSLGTVPVWCPTTAYGTWVMRQDGRVMITGNTKAIGRALAALGFGTQFALELDEGDRVVDSPVTPAQRAPRVDRGDRSGLTVVAEHPAEDRAEGLRNEVAAGLAADKDAAAKLPKAAEEMSADELEKTLAWLRNRARRQA